MTGDGQRSLTYDDQDRPETITMGNVVTAFRYTPDGDRYLQRTISSGDASVNRTIYYVDKVYERVEWDHQVSEERTYVGKSTVIESKAGALREVRYLHVDRLGSSDAATDSTGAEILTDAHGYDAYGRPRGRDWQPSNDQMHPNGEFGATTNHGFTGQEQLDETLLTHMNSRIYDYRLGRFLSVDPIIGNAANSQSINPYTYVGNNPLSGIDPTGYDEVSQKDEEPFVENRRDCFAECRNTSPSIGAYDQAPTKNGAIVGTSGGTQSLNPGTDVLAAYTPDGTANKDGSSSSSDDQKGGGSKVDDAKEKTAAKANSDPKNQKPAALERKPTPLVDKDGNVVLGANGKPALIPYGFDIKVVLDAAKSDKASYDDSETIGMIKISSDLAHFSRKGEWDLQRLDGKFDDRFIDSATILIGMYAAGVGMSRDQILDIENDIAKTSNYTPGTLKDSQYTYLPVRNVTNTDIGMHLVTSGAIR
jgi:RHS repeat-associated protein